MKSGIIFQQSVCGCRFKEKKGNKRMATIKCEKGHYYDDKMFFRCPYCGIDFELVTAKGIKEETEMVQVSILQESDKTELV